MNKLERRDRAFTYACAYLSFLFVSVIVMWWLILFGGNPIQVQEASLYDVYGNKSVQFRSGDQFIIKGVMCSTDTVGIEVYPTLDGRNGVKYPLDGTVFLAEPGCFKAALGAVMPIVPSGDYSLNITIKYQNNLVGRDGTAMLPSLRLKVKP